jgi:hypothetical protein
MWVMKAFHREEFPLQGVVRLIQGNFRKKHIPPNYVVEPRPPS